MKHLSTLLLLGATSFGLSAQPILNHAGDYKIGDRAWFLYYDSINVTSIATGANATWDLRNIGNLDPDTLFQEVLAVANTPYSGVFPSATHVIHTDDGAYNFQIINGTRSEVIGIVDSANGLEIKYSKPYAYISRPFSGSNVVLDTFRRSYNYQTYAMNGTGYSRTSSLGYGNLLLNGRVLSNVMLVKQETYSLDTIQGLGFIVQNDIISYNWYEENGREAVVSIDTFFIDYGVSSEYGISAKVMFDKRMTGLATQVKDDWNINVSQNEQAELVVSGITRQGAYEISITDLSGRQLWQDELKLDTERNIIVNTQELGLNGIYVLQLKELSSGFSHAKKVALGQ